MCSGRWLWLQGNIDCMPTFFQHCDVRKFHVQKDKFFLRFCFRYMRLHGFDHMLEHQVRYAQTLRSRVPPTIAVVPGQTREFLLRQGMSLVEFLHGRIHWRQLFVGMFGSVGWHQFCGRLHFPECCVGLLCVRKSRPRRQTPWWWAGWWTEMVGVEQLACAFRARPTKSGGVRLAARCILARQISTEGWFTVLYSSLSCIIWLCHDLTLYKNYTAN